MSLDEALDERNAQKTPKRKRAPRFEAGGPRHGRAGKAAQPTAATQFAIYDGRDRLGSFRHDGDSFVAFDRLGRQLGIFGSEGDAIAAVERRAA
jgi:hypothetical protein